MTNNNFINLLTIIIIFTFSFCTLGERKMNQPIHINILLGDTESVDFQPFAETRYPTIMSEKIERETDI